MVLPVGVEPDGLVGIPVADSACPATGMPPASFLVERRVLREDGLIQALVALGRGHEPDGAVAMLMDVPLHEGMDLEPGFLEAVEAVYRVVWAVVAGTEKCLREGIIVGDPRTTVRGRDAEPFQRDAQG